MNPDPQNNLILAGLGNIIKDSESCTIINGSDNIIEAKKNVHIVGDGITANQSDAFYVGCENGLFCTGDVVAFGLSDKRLKDNIRPMENCLQKILRLDAIEFDWSEKQSTYRGKDIGLIAQQVEEIAPEIVETRRNGFKAIRYEKITALLVGAIKEQQAIIDSIEKELTINLSH